MRASILLLPTVLTSLIFIDIQKLNGAQKPNLVVIMTDDIQRSIEHTRGKQYVVRRVRAFGASQKQFESALDSPQSVQVAPGSGWLFTWLDQCHYLMDFNDDAFEQAGGATLACDHVSDVCHLDQSLLEERQLLSVITLCFGAARVHCSCGAPDFVQRPAHATY